MWFKKLCDVVTTSTYKANCNATEAAKLLANVPATLVLVSQNSSPSIFIFFHY